VLKILPINAHPFRVVSCKSNWPTEFTPTHLAVQTRSRRISEFEISGHEYHLATVEHRVPDRVAWWRQTVCARGPFAV